MKIEFTKENIDTIIISKRTLTKEYFATIVLKNKGSEHEEKLDGKTFDIIKDKLDNFLKNL